MVIHSQVRFHINNLSFTDCDNDICRELWLNHSIDLKQISMRLPDCFSNYTHYLPKIIHYSGRSAFQKGHYMDCLSEPELKYGMVNYAVNGSESGLFSGLCYPKVCSESALTNYTNEALNALHSPLTISRIDSSAIDYEYPVFWVTYLTIALLSLFTLLTLYSTLSRLFRKEKSTTSHMLVSAFDLTSNMKHFKTRQGENLNILDGVRAIAMIWVVMGHSYSFSSIPVPINLLTIQHTIHEPFLLILEAGFMAVDTFFMLGGFFLAFVILRQKQFGLSKLLLAVPQRALRIWPAYIMLMMFGYSIQMHLGSGPFWPSIQSYAAPCQDMWKDILFISNLAGDGQHICMGWAWYLQVDFQLFVVGLLLMFLYKKYPVVSITTTCLLGLASVIFNLIFTYHYKIHITNNLEGPNPNFNIYYHNVYAQTWGHCGPYFIGMLFGIAYMNHRNARKVRLIGSDAGVLGRVEEACKRQRYLQWIIQWVGIGIMVFVIVMPYPVQKGGQWRQISHTLFKTFDKYLFVIGILLTVVPSTLGLTHSVFNLLLTNRFFSFIAKISFCTYLVHFLIVGHVIATKTYDVYYSLPTVFPIFLGILILSLFFGFLLTVVVELPFANLQKHLMSILLRKSTQTQKEERFKQSDSNLMTRSQSLLTSENNGQSGATNQDEKARE